jgi:light-regulated signal transduction histidine kinase (bacteriophytochrome)
MECTIVERRKEDNQSMRSQLASHQHITDMTVETVSTELEALSYSISHDLRAPLRAIRNNCEWLSKRHEANFDTKESTLLQQITKSSEQMEKLLDGLLAFSKLVKSDPQHSFIDMTMIAQKVIDELLECETAPTSYAITLHPLLPAYGDALFIRQVWYNLLSNAFKYTQYREKKEVEINSYSYDGETVYCVHDNGVGFDMQYVDRLFGVFHRLHEIEEFEGTGVGLAIVKRIIQRHGGRVWAEGKVDKGAQFYFTLPKTEKNNKR